MATNNVLLFWPNIIGNFVMNNRNLKQIFLKNILGYGRIILTFISIWIFKTHPVLTITCYATSIIFLNYYSLIIFISFLKNFKIVEKVNC